MLPDFWSILVGPWCDPRAPDSCVAYRFPVGWAPPTFRGSVGGAHPTMTFPVGWAPPTFRGSVGGAHPTITAHRYYSPAISSAPMPEDKTGVPPSQQQPQCSG